MTNLQEHLDMLAAIETEAVGLPPEPTLVDIIKLWDGKPLPPETSE